MAHLLLKKNEPAKVGKHQIRGWEASVDRLFFCAQSNFIDLMLQACRYASDLQINCG